MISALIGGAALLCVIWIQFIKPWLRGRRLRRPCEVHFVLRPERHDYVVHDNERHHVRVLVLPAHSVREIEIGFKVKVNFRESELVFGCDGDDDAKPYASQWIDSFTDTGGKTIWIPGEDEGHSIDMHKFYHRRLDRLRNIGTHYVNSFRLITRAPGEYKAYVSFLTDEIEGNAELSIIVEEKPKTRMKCSKHRDCYVRPLTRSANG